MHTNCKCVNAHAILCVIDLNGDPRTSYCCVYIERNADVTAEYVKTVNNVTDFFVKQLTA